MSSKITKHPKREAPKTKYKITPTKRSAALEKGIATLEKYKSKDVIQQTMIDVVKKLYTSRDIQNINSATSALDSLMSDDTEGFKRKYSAMINKIPV